VKAVVEFKKLLKLFVIDIDINDWLVRHLAHPIVTVAKLVRAAHVNTGLRHDVRKPFLGCPG
jgi:hypothetical protein